MHVLLVEDDRPLREAVRAVLLEEGYQVDEADNGDDGLHLAEQGIYDLLLLDLMLPGRSGLALTRDLRRAGVTTPILLLTARDAVDDRVAGLDAGADDYLGKPFATQELLARTRALLRRNGKMSPEGDIVYGRITLRPRAHDAYVDGQPLKLTAKECKLLEFLLLNREQILTREQIFDRIWGVDVDTGASVVDVYMHYLRKKLAVHQCEGLLQTVRGVGYMLKEKKPDVC